MRAWFTITCGISDRPSSTSWMRSVRSIVAGSDADGVQKVVSLTQ